MRPLLALACLALVACTCATASPSTTSSPSSSSLPLHMSPQFNPRGRSRAVSRSSFHTDAGRIVDTHRSYPGQGESHTVPASKPVEVPLSAGRHLWESSVYAEVSSLLKHSVGSLEGLPSLDDAAAGEPVQIKMSVTSRPAELVLSWLTWNVSGVPVVEWGLSSGALDNSVKAQTVTFVDPNTLHLIRYIHNALVTDLPASQTIYYRVGDDTTEVWSEELTLTSPGDGTEIQRLGVFGDLGVVNSVSMQALSDEVAAGNISLIWHLGDYAYNMDELQGITGDVFLQDLQNMTSSVPYMGCPGNHEQAFNFSHYKNKFSLYNYITDPSGTTDDHTWWYSWDYMSGGAKVHVLALDSELYYWDYLHSTEVGGNFPAMIQAQWQWIVDDLTAAYDSGEYAWIFAYSHRPMYCSNTDDVPDCTTDAETLRRGILNANGTYQWGFEDALSVRPIDLYLSAHEHSYERTLPVRNGVIDQQADLNRYVDPKYPTHIIAGAGGCREYFNYFDEVFYGPWSVVRSATYGYGHLTVHNATHLHWDQLLDEGRGGRDELWIVKTQDDDSDEDAKDSRSRPSVPADDDAGVVWPERLALE